VRVETRVKTTSAPPARSDADPGAEVQKRFARLWTPGHVPGEAGIWIFIFGDMTLYGVLFVSFIRDHSRHAALFDQSARTLGTGFGAVNTLLLLTSSLCVAAGVRSVRERIAPERAPILFRVALACAFLFVVNKSIEYTDLITHHHTPDKNLFYTYFFILTGVHLMHLLAGSCVLVFLLRKSKKGTWDRNDIRTIEAGASFWHVVDLLWIILFPLLYLVS
jgi:nitric oxide reductase NorE protein